MSGGLAGFHVETLSALFGNMDHDSLILDFGCGDGRYFPLFSKFFKKENIYGVEISQKRVDKSHSIGWDNALKIEPLEKLPFSDDYFDFINMDQVIEHISAHEIDFYLQEFSRILKKGGQVFITTPNYPIKRVYDIFQALFYGYWYKVFDDPTHVTHYDFKKLSSLLTKHFTLVELKPTGGFFYRIIRKNFLSNKIIAICNK